MNKNTNIFLIPGHAGQIECAVDLPTGDARGLALIAHPHPLYGGTMDNKVIHTLARAFLGLGYVAARMNFRGVGQSQGEHDEGRGETDDAELYLQHLRTLYPELPLAFAGFSFGTVVMAQLQQRLQQRGEPAAERLVLVGTAAGKWEIPPVPQDSILIHGEMDETIPLLDVLNWARPQDLPVCVIPGADHFFHRKLQHIRNLVSQMWRP